MSHGLPKSLVEAFNNSPRRILMILTTKLFGTLRPLERIYSLLYLFI